MKRLVRPFGAGWRTLLACLLLVGCAGRNAPTGLAKWLSDGQGAPPGLPADVRHLSTPPWARLLGVWGDLDLYHPDISGAVFLPNATLATFGGGQFEIWELRSRRLIQVLDPCPAPEPAGAAAAKVYPGTFRLAFQGSLAAVGDGRGRVCVRHLPDGAIVRQFQADESPIRFLAFSDPGHLVSYAHRFPEPPMSILPPDPCRDPRTNCPPPKPDGILRRWDLSTGQTTGQIHLGDTVSDPPLVRSPDGSHLVGLFRGRLQGLDTRTMTVAWTASDTLWPLSFSSNERLLAIDHARDPERLRIVELLAADGSEGRSMDVLTDLGHIHVLDVNQGTRRAALFANDTLIFWDTGQDRRLGSVNRHEWPGASAPLSVRGGTFSSDGTVLASWSGGSVTLWDVARQRPVEKRRGHLAAIRDLEFSRDGTRALSTSADGTIRGWSVQDGRELFSWALGPARAAFSPDGSRVLVGVDDTVSVRDVGTGNTIWEVDERLWDARPVYSYDGSRVATVAKQGGITVHEANTGRELWHHDEPSNAPVFAPDGKSLVGMQAMKMVLWDAKTGQRKRQLYESWHEPRFDADGNLLFFDSYQHRLVRLPLNGAPRTLREARVWGQPTLVAADGERVFSKGPGSKVQLLRVSTGIDPEAIDSGDFGGAPSTIALSRDSSQLLVGTERGLVLHFAVEADTTAGASQGASPSVEPARP